MYLALNNLQRLICHKTQTNNQQSFLGYSSGRVFLCLCRGAVRNFLSLSRLGSTNLNHSEPGSNGNEEILRSPGIYWTGDHQIHFSVILRIHLGRVLLLSRGYCQRILCPIDRVFWLQVLILIVPRLSGLQPKNFFFQNSTCTWVYMTNK